MVRESGAFHGGAAAENPVRGGWVRFLRIHESYYYLKKKENAPSPQAFKQRNETVRFGRKKDEFVEDELERGASGNRKPSEVVQMSGDRAATILTPHPNPRHHHQHFTSQTPTPGFSVWHSRLLFALLLNTLGVNIMSLTNF